MRKLENRKESKDFIDDGRVIADMDIDGMPKPGLRRLLSRGYWRKQENGTDEVSPKLKKKEWKNIVLGIISSYLVVGIVIFGSFALFILFCTKIWFK